MFNSAIAIFSPYFEFIYIKLLTVTTISPTMYSSAQRSAHNDSNINHN
ncbi:hypothetical protein VPHF86_0333 [Vibrio phage F86]